jgi:hypothetical protein
VQESGEQGEDSEDVRLGEGKQLGWMRVVPVTQLVCKYGLDFSCLAGFNERIKDDNVFSLLACFGC